MIVEYWSCDQKNSYLVSILVSYDAGAYNQDVDVLVGWNKDDGLILTTPLYTTPSLYLLYRSLWSVIAPGILFHLPVTDTNLESSKKANQLADFYLGGTSHIKPENFAKITGALFALFPRTTTRNLVRFFQTYFTIFQICSPMRSSPMPSTVSQNMPKTLRKFTNTNMSTKVRTCSMSCI